MTLHTNHPPTETQDKDSLTKTMTLITTSASASTTTSRTITMVAWGGISYTVLLTTPNKQLQKKEPHQQ